MTFGHDRPKPSVQHFGSSFEATPYLWRQLGRGERAVERSGPKVESHFVLRH